jgi:hypothetical protein
MTCAPLRGSSSSTAPRPAANDMLWWLKLALLTPIAVRQNAMLSRSRAGPGSSAVSSR